MIGVATSADACFCIHPDQAGRAARAVLACQEFRQIAARQIPRCGYLWVETRVHGIDDRSQIRANGIPVHVGNSEQCRCHVIGNRIGDFADEVHDAAGRSQIETPSKEMDDRSTERFPIQRTVAASQRLTQLSMLGRIEAFDANGFRWYLLTNFPKIDAECTLVAENPTGIPVPGDEPGFQTRIVVDRCRVSKPIIHRVRISQCIVGQRVEHGMHLWNIHREECVAWLLAIRCREARDQIARPWSGTGHGDLWPAPAWGMCRRSFAGTSEGISGCNAWSFSFVEGGGETFPVAHKWNRSQAVVFLTPGEFFRNRTWRSAGRAVEEAISGG